MLVGRPDELGAAVRHLESRAPLLVTGEAGIGKTALLREAAHATGRRVFEGGGLQTLAWDGYFALERACGAPLGDGDPVDVAVKVLTRVGDGVLVLDDLQWIDAETLALLPLLAGRIPLLAGLQTGDPRAAAAREAAERAEFDVLSLGPLADAHALAVVRGRRPDLPDQTARDIVAAAGGNAFVLEELSSTGPPSRTLRRALRVRLRGLSPAAREALAVVSLLGRGAESHLFGPVPAAELLDAQLVVAEPGAGGYRLRHSLISEAALAELTDAERRRLHARIARTVESAGESARHHQAAGELAPAHARALEAAATAVVPGERARHLGVAAECVEAGDPGADELRLRAAAALVEAGEHAVAERIVSSIESTEPQVAAEIRLHRARACLATGRRAETEVLLQEGLGLVRGSGLAVEARLQAEAAELPLWDWDADASVELARKAVTLARDAGIDGPGFATTLGRALYAAGSPDCIEPLAVAVEQARVGADGAAECAAAGALCAAYHLFGRPAEALALAEATLERARSLHLRADVNAFRFLVAFQRLANRGAAREAIEELSLLLQEPGLGPMRDQATAYLALALAHVGQTEDASVLLERSVPAAASRWGRALMLYARSEVEWAAGRVEDGLAAVSDCLDLGVPPLQLWAELARGWLVLPAASQGDPPAAPLMRGAHVALRALACLHDGKRLAEAERLFVEAADLFAGLVVHEELRCRWAAGEAARCAGASERAVEQLLAVEQRAAACGFAPLVGRIQQSLRRAGLRRASRRATSSFGLTEREREILGLVGSGRTSAQIGRALGIAVGTVDGEIRSAMAKLDASTRLQAALLATRPLDGPAGRRRPLIVVRSDAAARAAREELERMGWDVRDGWPADPESASAVDRVAFAGLVASIREAGDALAAAARGAAIVAALDVDLEVEDAFLDDLRRLGAIDERDAANGDSLRLPREEERLLSLVAAGRSIAEAAAELHLSRRTAERRLAAARARLGVRTTAEAALALNLMHSSAIG